MQEVILIPHIKIQNANALSSPYTIGFPAMTAWLGFVHALERKIKKLWDKNISFNGVGIVSHKFDLQTYKGQRDYVHSIIGTSNPLNEKGERPSFIEEARCHLDVSIIIAFEGITKLEQEKMLQIIEKIIFQMNIAGGDILSFESPKIVSNFFQLKKLLMPGFLLIERRDLMIHAMEQGLDAMDALIDYLAVHYSCTSKNETESCWKGKRKETGIGESGWIIPIAIGFQALTQPKIVLNQRDEKTPHVFAETVITLGEFIMPYKQKIDSLDKILWHYLYDSENELYLCQQEIIEAF